MEKYDVVIAGGGPAGCIAAKALAEKGVSVLLVEKGAPEDAGHDWWDTVDGDIFGIVGMEKPEPPELVSSFDWEIVTSLGDTGAKAVMPPDKINVDRKLLGKRLLDCAEKSGANILFKTKVSGPVLKSGAVAGIVAENADGRKQEIFAPISIDATGWKAAIRSKAPVSRGFQRTVPREDFVVTYREIREDISKGGRSIVNAGEDNGAKWLSRNESGLSDIFACTLDTPGRRNPREFVEELIEKEGGVGSKILRGGVGERIPIRRGLDTFVNNGLMLIGDSACMANPINGSGVSSSMWGAKLAGEVAFDALENSDFSTSALWRYNYEYNTSRGAPFARLDVLRRFMIFQPPKFAHEMIKRGLFSENNLWHIENDFDFRSISKEDLKRKLPAFLSIMKYPDFSLKLTACLSIMALVVDHFMDYPAEYNKDCFIRWRRKTKNLFDVVSIISNA